MTNQFGCFTGVPFNGFTPASHGFNPFNGNTGFNGVNGWNTAFNWNPGFNTPAFNGYPTFNGFNGNGFNGNVWTNGYAQPFGQQFGPQFGPQFGGFDWNAFAAGCGYGCTNAFAWFNAQQGQNAVNPVQGTAQYTGSFNGFNPGAVFGYGFPFGPFPFQPRQQQAA